MRRKRRVGRPAKYQPRFCDKAEKLFGTGATSPKVASALKTHVATLYRWIEQHADFREAVRRGKAIADETVEHALFSRATGYSHGDCHVSQYLGEVTVTELTRHYPADTAAAIFWLKNRKPKEWRDRTDLHIEQEIAGVDPKVVEALRKKFASSVGAGE